MAKTSKSTKTGSGSRTGGSTKTNSSTKTNNSSSTKTNGSTITATNGKNYTVGQTIKGKSGNEYTMQSDGTMTCNGKTYQFNESGKIAPVQNKTGTGPTNSNNYGGSGTTGVTSPTTGKTYEPGSTIKGKSGKEYTVQSNGTMTCDGKTYVFNEGGKIALQSNTGGGNKGSVTMPSGKSYAVGSTVKSKSGKEYVVQSDGTMTYDGKKYVINEDGKIVRANSTNTGATISSTKNNSNNLGILEKLGAKNATEVYDKAIAAGYSSTEAKKLQSDFARLNAAASTASPENYNQFNVTQSDINRFNLMQGNAASTNALQTGTYTFNTKQYNNVQSDLRASLDSTKQISTNIDRALENTKKGTQEYKDLLEMKERMQAVNQSTTFVSNRLSDAYKATKAADDAVKQIVMKVTPDNLSIKIDGKVQYNSNNYNKSREGDNSKWLSYVDKGVIGKGEERNTSTVDKLVGERVSNGANYVLSSTDVLSSYDVKNNLESCTSKLDYAQYARCNGGLSSIVEYCANKGISTDSFKDIIDKYMYLDSDGNVTKTKQKPVNVDNWVNSYDKKRKFVGLNYKNCNLVADIHQKGRGSVAESSCASYAAAIAARLYKGTNNIQPINTTNFSWSAYGCSFNRKYTSEDVAKRKIDEELKKGKPVLVNTNGYGANSGKPSQHWAVVVGKDSSGEYLIIDPWDASRIVPMSEMQIYKNTRNGKKNQITGYATIN